MFRFWYFLGRLGFFRYEGLHGMHPSWWPMARVHYATAPYPDGRYSVAMPIGNACDYAQIFHGDVVPLSKPTQSTR